MSAIVTSSFNKYATINEGEPPHPLGTQYSEVGLDGTQYAKGRYAVRKNHVISYADIVYKT